MPQLNNPVNVRAMIAGLAAVNDKIEEVNAWIAWVNNELTYWTGPNPNKHPAQARRYFDRLYNMYDRLLRRRSNLEDDALILAEDCLACEGSDADRIDAHVQCASNDEEPAA